MTLIEDLPEDLVILLLETLQKISKASFIVFAYVNKFCYKAIARIAIEYDIKRSLKCYEIAEEGSLEILKWARYNGCEWDWKTCAHAALNGHLHILEWARSKGCPWDYDT